MEWDILLIAEGSIHTVQTPSSYLGYKTLKGMDGKKILNPIPSGELFEVGDFCSSVYFKSFNENLLIIQRR